MNNETKQKNNYFCNGLEQLSTVEAHSTRGVHVIPKEARDERDDYICELKQIIEECRKERDEQIAILEEKNKALLEECDGLGEQLSDVNCQLMDRENQIAELKEEKNYLEGMVAAYQYAISKGRRE